MTVPAVDAPARLVKLVLSDVLVLDHLLHLPPGTRLAGAAVDHHDAGAPTLLLYLEMSGVPDGADEVDPQYTARTSTVVELTGLQWRSRGLAFKAGPASA